MGRLEIAVENSAGGRQGPGPIITATGLQLASKLDAAGTLSVTVPAGDPRAVLLTPKCYIRPSARLGTGEWRELGLGIVDSLPTSIEGAGLPTLKFSGNDLLDELGNWLVRGLYLRGAEGAAISDGPSQILAYAPGWSLDTTSGYAQTQTPIYYQFAGETVLAALIKIAQLTGEHFRLGQGRQIVWLGKDRKHSGLRAVAPLGRSTFELPADTCGISSITRSYESHDLVFRVYPFGSGSGDARLTILGTTRTAPPGFDMSTGPGLYDNWIQATARMTARGLSYPIEREQSFSDIGAGSGGVLDPVSAANALFDAALVWLDRASQVQTTYNLKLAGCPRLPLPGELIRVQARQSQNGNVVLDVDEDLFVLGPTLSIEGGGQQTVTLEVSTVDVRPPTSNSYLMGAIQQMQYLATRQQ